MAASSALLRNRSSVPLIGVIAVEILIGLFILWVTITLVGHASWVLIRFIFRAITDTSTTPAVGTKREFLEPQKKDIRATYRVFDRMIARGLLNPDELARVRSKVVELEYPSSTPASTAASDTGSEIPTLDAECQKPPPVVASSPPPIVATLVEETANQQPPATTVVAEPIETAPALSRAEVIRSFLAAHNIRWGELVAGILIVVCSIGLVVNLWSELIQTHRVIPSLIFLCGNAAIFSAGLYTLSRWRLRHTSRAVLVIATLLVPLSVLAGLAAAGPFEDAVQLDDPISLVSILIGSSAYLFFLLRGARALVGRANAFAFAIGVATPVMLLPLLPAVTRQFSVHSGWAVGFGSLGLALTLIWSIRRRRRDTPLGIAATRNRYLQMGVGAFAFAVSVAYSAFVLRPLGFSALVPIAITGVPALIALAGAGRSMMKSAKHSTHRMVGCSIAVIAMLIAWMVLPMGLSESKWVWSWAVGMSLCGIFTGWRLRQPSWSAASTVPIGLAAMFSSPSWIGDVTWQSTTFLQRMIGGEPMIIAAAMAGLIAFIARLDRDPVRRRWTVYAALGWCGVALGIAGVLTFAPVTWLGAIPWWFVTAIVLLGLLVAIVLARNQRRGSGIVTVLVTLLVCSATRPMQVSLPLEFATSDVWMRTAVWISALLLLIREAADSFDSALATSSLQLAGEISPDRVASPPTQYLRHYSRASVVASMIATALGACFVQLGWSTSAWVVGLSAMLLLWAATTLQSSYVIQLSQIASVVLAAIVGYGQFAPSMYPLTAWAGNIAPWYWAIALTSVSATWLVVRRVSRINHTFTKSRLRYLSDPVNAMETMVDGMVVKGAAAVIVLGAAFSFVAQLTSASGISSVSDQSDVWLSTVAISVAAGVLLWMKRLAHGAAQRSIVLVLNGVALAATVWVACQIGTRQASDETLRLIVSTSIAAIGCLGVSWILARQVSSTLRRSIVVAAASTSAVIVALASAVLLTFGWFHPIIRTDRAELLPTLSVAGWWGIGSLIALYLAMRSQIRGLANFSAAAFPISIALVVPVYWKTSPVVWMQVAALGSLAWIAINRLLSQVVDEANVTSSAIIGSTNFARATGLVTAASVIVAAITQWSFLEVWFGPVGAALSALAVILWCTNRPRTSKTPASSRPPLPWPIGGSILAGQIAWMVCAADLATSSQFIQIMLVVWTAMSACSVAYFARSGSYGTRSSSYRHFWHTGAVTILIGGLITFFDAVTNPVFAWTGIVSCILSGIMVGLIGRDQDSSRVIKVSARLIGWFVVVVGGYIFSEYASGSGSESITWTSVVAWAAGWIVTWRVISPDPADAVAGTWSLSKKLSRATPDYETSVVLTLGVVAELMLIVLAGRHFDPATIVLDPLFAIRAVSIAFVIASAATRSSVRMIWQWTIALFVAIVSLSAVRIANQFGADPNQRLMIANLSAGVAVSMFAYGLGWIEPSARWVASRFGSAMSNLSGRITEAACQIALLVAASAAISSIGMLADGIPPAFIQLTIGTIVLAGLAIAELADRSNSMALRHVSVTTGLVALGLLASIEPEPTDLSLLAGSMRWLVASVATIPLCIFVAPKLLGPTMGQRWLPAFWRGAMIAGCAAAGSLIVMLTTEAIVRTQTGIDGLSKVLVVGVAITLASLGIIAALVAILTGPPSQWSLKVRLSDLQRKWLILASQAIGGITWLHLFLCKTNWAFIGLRQYWPFIVMALAFISVGATEWAKRRGDEVMSATLRQTALYLPLLPAIGFWFSGTAASLMTDAGWSWDFTGGAVSYELLLAVGAIYYIGLSALWKSTMPKLCAVILGNAALWVVLIQQPGWGFLSHPQAWMIPPAVCVLVVSHFYRDALQPSVSSGVRYASTLVIYISSTADMLLQEIGTSISGPIILVVLALIGMAGGVILRVRPFLYLGATFVFIGVTSMVWHATESLDQVWPWWAFGIGTGVCLLAGLMALEKNKPQLQRLAKSLATWEM